MEWANASIYIYIYIYKYIRVSLRVPKNAYTKPDRNFGLLKKHYNVKNVT